MAPAKNFGKDPGLQARMYLTLFLLGLLYVILMAVLLAAGTGVVAMVVIAAVIFGIQFFTSDKIALASMGAHEVSPEEAPQLHGMIDRLCMTAGLPKPKVAIAQTSMPNAFAVGRSPKSASVCCTTGILEMLPPNELEAVLAHELTHIANRDVAVMTLASFFASIASFIVQMGFWFGMGYNDDDEDNGGNAVMVAILVSALVYAISFFLMRALSRYREFAADRGAAIITGHPSALVAALYRIDGGMNQIPQQDMRQADGLAAFFIFPPKLKQGLGQLVATHPTLEQRVAALQRYESQLQSAR